MKNNSHPDRLIVSKLTLSEEDGTDVQVGSGAAERLKMMWQIAQDCWAFVSEQDAKREFQRDVARIERGRR